MQDPCNPPPHHVHPFVHHHPPWQAIGRIRRHGSHRIAQRLHGAVGGCPAGPPVFIGGATLKAVLPAVAFVGLTTLASSVASPEGQSADYGFSAVGNGALGDIGPVGSVGTWPHKHSHQPHPPISIPEPPSFTLLLLMTVCWMGIRFCLRRGRVPSAQGKIGGTAPVPPNPPSSIRTRPIIDGGLSCESVLRTTGDGSSRPILGSINR